MKHIKNIMYLFTIFAFLIMLSNDTVIQAASKDTKAPAVSLTQDKKTYTKSAVKVTVKATDTSGIKTVKWASGTKDATYFSKNGTSLKLAKNIATVSIEKNGIYSFYVVDKAGNKKISTIKISNIDKTAPAITLAPNKKTPTNTSVKVTVGLKDRAGIKTVKWAAGKQNSSYFKNNGTALKLNSNNTTAFTVKENGTYTVYAMDKTGNGRISEIAVSNIDNKAPAASLSYSVLNQAATIKVSTKDTSGVKSIQYLKGTVTDPASEKWNNSNTLFDTVNFKVKTSGTYSVLITDKAGNTTVETLKVRLELRAVWISYLEFSNKGYSESQFKKKINEMFDNSVDLKMNAVIVQVRPMGDALYNSDYFPWSVYVSGKQGKDPGFDPLEYMVEAAHKRGLEFHAWLNPYRVTLSTTDYNTLSKDNPARIWKEDSSTKNDRNVLSFGSSLYYNPASKEVQNMIVSDIENIVNKYDVDGIHFDDYFYPSLGSSYKSNFDYKEYNTYKESTTKAGKTPMTIDAWRRNNVSTLVRNVYKSIKAIDSSVEFGISPHGNISNLMAKDKYYVDVEKWLSTDGYVDYIAPQIYWSFTHKICPFDDTVQRWLDTRTANSVKMYIGIANYKAKATISDDPEWKKANDELKRQVEYGRKTGSVDGFLFFRYEHFFKDAMQVEVDNLIEILDKK
ncbi:uncharacterized lipoprotein YddW (UPF0748 family) [Mobilisporobacter senegalensis]|uniref:Uncharacterized lipoprotein YddW (UPF0748 family) n=1 Tax=Mobilisporobacter senegalensis TaxID=1329262 RepID=A0A3N1XRC3_9FIRM|nr:family 10 glycosylhydrolase [Mobilisporobacter senegalensis]ROR29213.1 uncharacterized lipoprotein YddW (UPF0748 family) [Mobilisporobacter senegalensis]